MIAFRVDANRNTATGHAMRCMSVADALIARGEKVVFLVADKNSEVFVSERGYRTETLNTDWQNMTAELPKLLELLDHLKPTWLVISGYQTTRAYLEKVSERVKTLFFDDLNDRFYPATAIINYNIYAEHLGYAEEYAETGSSLLLGPSFAPLRKQFENILPSREIRHRILVSVGGTDNYGMAQHLIKAASRRAWCDVWQFHILSGHFAADMNLPPSLVDSVFVHKGVTEMAALMASCDFAVTAGGSTCYELCACGVPSVTYSLSDDQILGVKEFDRLGIFPYCGDIRENIDRTVETVLDKLEMLINNRELHSSIAKKMKEVVDGQGAARIAAFLSNN